MNPEMPAVVKAQPVVGMWAASDAPGTPARGVHAFSVQSVHLWDDPAGRASHDFDQLADRDFGCARRWPPRLPLSRVRAVCGFGFSGARRRKRRRGHSAGHRLLSRTYSRPWAALRLTQLAVSAGQMILGCAAARRRAAEHHHQRSGKRRFHDDDQRADLWGGRQRHHLILLSGLNPSTPVGTQATEPDERARAGIRWRYAGRGATIGWSASNGLQLSACGGASSCSVTSDQNGDAATWLMPAAIGWQPSPQRWLREFIVHRNR